MTPDPVLAAASAGEAITFWVLGPLAAIAAIMMVLSRKAVHSALFLAAVMLCLAGLYAAQDAPFLAAAQVIVYTGAVLMLFLFVLMLVGVDSSDSLVETLRGQRAAAAVVGIAFAALVMAAVYRATHGLHAVGLGQAQPDGNVQGLARLLFVKYVFAFEITSALLITAALGAMVLAHQERITPKSTQRELAKKRFREADPFPLPGPGVYALHHSNATPALLPDGSPAPGSVSPSLESTPAGDDGTVRQS
jgi:NADH-quinone oxidoreductase subunit J